MLSLAAIALASEPDTLAGVTVGSQLNRADYACTGDVCERAGTVAGESGAIRVYLCGTRVRMVSFTMVFVPVEVLAMRPPVAPAGYLTQNSTIVVGAASAAIDDGLRVAGWRVLARRVLPEPGSMEIDYVDATGRIRGFGLYKDTSLSSLGNFSDPSRYTLVLQSERGPACASGL